MLSTAVVFVGGDAVEPALADELPEQRWVVAADSGLDHANRIGVRVDLMVGDLDSVSAESLEGYTGPIERHPPDKDATDFELALDRAVAHPNIDRLIVVGGHGGRLDHLLANATVITSPRFAGVDVEWIAGTTRVQVIRDHCELHGAPGEVVSLLAMGGDATGITTSGLRWELTDDALARGSARGISNEFIRPVATVQLTGGCLLSIQPFSM